MTTLPVGWRFRPTDKEKIAYLLHKVIGKHASPNIDYESFIGTGDVYGDKEPWEVFGDCRESELHLFTKLKKKRSDNERRARNAGKGTWNNKGQKTPIYNRRQQVMGYKRTFKYQSKKSGGDDSGRGEWLLTEYILADWVVKCKNNDYALCVLKKKGSHVQEDGVLDDVFDDIFEGNWKGINDSGNHGAIVVWTEASLEEREPYTTGSHDQSAGDQHFTNFDRCGFLDDHASVGSYTTPEQQLASMEHINSESAIFQYHDNPVVNDLPSYFSSVPEEEYFDPEELLGKLTSTTEDHAQMQNVNIDHISMLIHGGHRNHGTTV